MLLNDTQTSEPAILSNLLIAPSGRIAEYHGKLQLSASPEASSNKDLQGIRVLDESATQAKALVIYRLAQQGINIEQEKMWLQLETPDEYLDNQDGNSQLGIFIWPASLCFALIRNDQQEEILNSPSNLVLEKCKDPLERAESWFNARQIREEMIEMKRKNDEATTKLVKEASQLDEDDGACEIPPHPNQYISAQDASSIYPTPPDGLRSQVLGSSMNNETHASTGSSGAKEAIDDLNNETSMNVSPFISALDPVISSSSYIQSESTDIFGEIDGEMDSELFAANGLTEDDFSFFDKPTAEENIDLHDDQATDSIENEALEIRPNGFVQDRMRKPATEHSSDSKIEPDLRGNDQIIKGNLT